MFIQTRMMMVSSITLREKLCAKQQMNKNFTNCFTFVRKIDSLVSVMMRIFLNLSDL